MGVFRQGGSNRYKGKKQQDDRSHGFGIAQDRNFSPAKKSLGYGELPRRESPNFRDSSFYNARRPQNDYYEESEEIREPSSQYYRNKLDEVDAKENMNQTPRRESSDMYNNFKETSENDKSKDIFPQERRISYEKELGNQYEDPADMPIQENSSSKYDYMRKDSGADRSFEIPNDKENNYHQETPKQVIEEKKDGMTIFNQNIFPN